MKKNICLLLKTKNWQSHDLSYFFRDILKYCNSCFILDLNSTDNTIETIKNYCIAEGVFNVQVHNETPDRDFNWLLQKAKAESNSKWLAKGVLNTPFRFLPSLGDDLDTVLSSDEDSLDIPYIGHKQIEYYRTWIWNSSKNWQYNDITGRISIEGREDFTRKKIHCIALEDTDKNYNISNSLQAIYRSEENLFLSLNDTFSSLFNVLGVYQDNIHNIKELKKKYYMKFLERYRYYLLSLKTKTKSVEEYYGYYLTHASFSFFMGDVEETEIFYKKAIECLPSRNEPFMNLCYLYESMERYDLVISICDTYLLNKERIFKSHNNSEYYRIGDPSCYYASGMRGHYMREKAAMIINNDISLV